jgi:hypothetical protein
MTEIEARTRQLAKEVGLKNCATKFDGRDRVSSSAGWIANRWAHAADARGRLSQMTFALSVVCRFWLRTSSTRGAPASTSIPPTGDVALSVDRSQRIGRWLFNLLHSWDLPSMLLRHDSATPADPAQCRRAADRDHRHHDRRLQRGRIGS